MAPETAILSLGARLWSFATQRGSEPGFEPVDLGEEGIHDLRFGNLAQCLSVREDQPHSPAGGNADVGLA